MFRKCFPTGPKGNTSLPPLWLVALTLEQWSSSCRPFALPLAPGSPLPQVARADSPLYYASKWCIRGGLITSLKSAPRGDHTLIGLVGPGPATFPSYGADLGD